MTNLEIRLCLASNWISIPMECNILRRALLHYRKVITVTCLARVNVPRHEKMGLRVSSGHYVFRLRYEPGHSISYRIECAPSEISDQPAHRAV